MQRETRYRNIRHAEYELLTALMTDEPSRSATMPS